VPDRRARPRRGGRAIPRRRGEVHRDRRGQRRARAAALRRPRQLPPRALLPVLGGRRVNKQKIDAGGARQGEDLRICVFRGATASARVDGIADAAVRDPLRTLTLMPAVGETRVAMAPSGGPAMSEQLGEQRHLAALRDDATATTDHGLLLDIANLLATKLEPELLFEAIAHVVRNFLNIARASLAVYDPE